MESFKRFVQAALNQATSPSPVNQMELERARIEWERDDMPGNPWRAAGRPGVGEDDATEAILGLGNELLATKSRESALWACLEGMVTGERVIAYSDQSDKAEEACKARDLPALCSALGVEVGDE